MDGEFGSYTVNGGWLIFLALAALWVALAVEARSRRLTSMLEAALKEAEQLREAVARPGGEPGGDRLGPELEQLASAVDGEGKGATAEPRAAETNRPAGGGNS